LKAYLESKGKTLTPSGQEFLTQCMFCDDKKGHLYINETKKVFFCHKCGEAGNVWKLKRHFGDLKGLKIIHENKYKLPPTGKDKDFHQKLTQTAMEYLKSQRGLKNETIKQFMLGCDSENITIPYYKNNRLVNIKYRSIKEKQYKREEGCESTLFNIDRIDKTKDLIVTEGEFDCISAVQVGYENTISISTGAQGFNPEWIDFFDSCSGRIYMAYDNDEKGNEGSDKIAKKIGNYRCYRALLPAKDFNDCLMAGFTKEDIDKILLESKPYTLQNFIHIAQIADRVNLIFRKEDKGKGLKLHNWYQFNEKLGGLRPAEITILTGETASGKTTFALNIIYFLLSQGERVIIASTEMKAEAVLMKLYSIHMKKSFYDFTEEEHEKACKYFITKYLFFIDIYGSLSIDEISDYLDYGNRKYDIKFALLDHLHFFINSGTDRMVNEIERFMRGLTIIKAKTNMSLILVAHPAKLKNEAGIVSMNDLKGASAIKQDADNIATLWRDKKGEEKGRNDVYLNFEKVRNDSGLGGKVKYVYNPDNQTYEEL